MNPFKTFKELFRRYPLFRALLLVLIVGTVLIITAFIGRTAKKAPVILSIDPPVGLPGDVLVIKGENFGDVRDTSYVEFSGSRLTASGFISWSDTEIQLVLPSNVKDGLVVVGTSVGRSQPGFFANKAGIPVAVHSDPQVTLPTITEISPASAAIGQCITITGSNFGAVKGSSMVYFTANRENTDQTQNTLIATSGTDFIPASELDYDYPLWSDTEIKVRIPDGAQSGQIYVQTAKGESELIDLTVTTPAGKKTYDARRTYVLQLSADITNNSVGQDANITLYMPRPPISSMQPVADLNEYYPEPLIKNDSRDIIYQRPLNKIVNNRQRFNQDFVVTVYEVQGNIKSSAIKPFVTTTRILYTTYTSPDACIPSGAKEIEELKNKIVGREKNPYKQASLIYNYLIDNFGLHETTRNGNASILTAIEEKKGDAYDFAMLFVALCRNAGIPAVPISGILAEDNFVTRNHWWAEIYFENYGWFPVDVALGAGAKFTPFTPIEDVRNYYFGNMDSQHIALSRGWNQIKPSLQNSKTVYRPRTYALQSIWEETNSETVNYSSVWNKPAIIGIY